MRKLMLVLLFLISGCGRVINRNNPYPSYCTEEPGGVWGQEHYTDVAESPNGEITAFVYSGNPYGNPPGRDTIGIYFYHEEQDSFVPFLTGLIFSGFPLPGGLDFSPDGEWLVFSWGKQIWKVKVNGDSLTQLTFSGENFYPRWSPDGRKIVFDSNKDAPHGENVIWMMNSDGSGLKRLDEWGMGERREPSFNIYGDKVLHIRWGITGGPAIALMDTSGSNVEIILKARDINAIEFETPNFSPDGSKILFVAQRPGEGPMVWVMDADGSNPVSLAWGKYGIWSKDGRKILYTRLEKGDIWIMDSNGCNKTPFIGDFNFLEGGVR